MTKATSAPRPRTKNIGIIAPLFAGLLLIMAVGQLFSFEKFIPLLQRFGLPGGDMTALLVATVLTTSEIFALPFLLRMKLSPLMRTFSMVCSWIAVSLWLKLTLWVMLMKPDVDTVGILGASLKLPIGWWSVLMALALVVLAIWTTWGLWPHGRSRTKNTSH